MKNILWLMYMFIPPEGWKSLYCEYCVVTSGWLLFQRGPAECGVSECDRGTSTRRRLWLTRSGYAVEKYIFSDTSVNEWPC